MELHGFICVMEGLEISCYSRRCFPFEEKLMITKGLSEDWVTDTESVRKI